LRPALVGAAVIGNATDWEPSSTVDTALAAAPPAGCVRAGFSIGGGGAADAADGAGVDGDADAAAPDSSRDGGFDRLQSDTIDAGADQQGDTAPSTPPTIRRIPGPATIR